MSTDLKEIVFSWLPPFALIVVGVITIILYRKIFFKSSHIDASESRWTKQLVLVFIIVLFLIGLLLVLPISETMKGQLFNLFGIAITATIALSSTTFVGNTMAGFMLRAIDAVRPGDFLKVDNYFGKVSEQGLLHTEIQTEDRDLTTLPNLFLVTTPLTVVRSSGTIVSATVSLGYDVPRLKIEELLIEAGEQSGLKGPFVQVLELGDFSVTYRVAGFLEDVKYLISFRSKLRGHMLDVLHENGVEIVSPNFMNQRVYSTEKTFIPKKIKLAKEDDEAQRVEDLVFDKADEAESIERVKELLQKNEDEIETLSENQGSESEKLANKKRIELLKKREDYLLKLLKSKMEAD